MKKARLLIAVLICLLFAETVGVCSVSAASAAKTYKNKLVKVKIKGSNPKDYNYYYYNKKGKKLKKAWKTVKVKGKKQKFYFGKNGKAYKAKKHKQFKYNVVTKKIKSVTYGFGSDGYLLTGLYVGPGFNNTGKIYYFDKKGVLDQAVTDQIKAAAKTYADSAELRKLIEQYAGKLKKTVKADNPCTLVDGVAPLFETIDYYETCEVQYYTMPDQKEIVHQITGSLRSFGY